MRSTGGIETSVFRFVFFGVSWMNRCSKILSSVIFAVTFVVSGVLSAEEKQTEYSVSRLFMGRNRTYSENEDSVERGVVLLDFFNDACGPCRAMMPAVDSLVQRGYRISKINTDKFPDWARRFNINKIPCFVVIVDGREVARHTGVTSEENLEKLLVRAGGEPARRMTHPENFNTERLVQNAESAWRGREANVTVQDIMAGRYVFSENFDRVNSSAQVASAAEIPTSQLGGRGGLSSENQNWSGDDSDSSAEHVPTQNWQVVSRETSVEDGNSGGVPIRDLSLQKSEDSLERQSRILSSTVRIRVYSDGEGNGTGTLIDSRSGHALILTCGHLFSEFQKGDSISVDVFTSEGVVTLPGNYVHHDKERDLGLLTLAFSGEVETSPVAKPNFVLRKGMPITTCGCSNGENPTLQQGKVTHLNRYLGPSNIEVSAVPVPGRSGGGMFAENGELIGVCFAADPEEQEGLFTSLSEIHAYFRSLRMERFVLEARNDSKQNPEVNENVIALHDLPMRDGALGGAEAEGVRNENQAMNSFQPVSGSSLGRAENHSSVNVNSKFTVPRSTSSQELNPPTANIQPTSQFSPSEQSAEDFENVPLKKAEPEYVSLAEMNTVEPIVPAEEVQETISERTPQPAVTLVPERTLTGEEAPAWPPRWEE